MNVLTLFQTFKTQEKCIEYLEQKRWKGEPECPYCESRNCGRHASSDRKNQRWQCYECQRAFSVTVGTIFHRTHVPLQNWFILLSLMLNAKKSASAYQLARDLGMRRPTVWSMMQRVRVAMAEDQKQSRMLHGLVEADETWIGGKPRKNNKHDESKKNKRGRGTKKPVILGAVERGGKVIAERAKNTSGKSIKKFLSRVIDTNGTMLITDEWKGYRPFGNTLTWSVVNHATEYANGLTHTNTIEGFWAMLKRAWYGQHHHYSEKYLPLYVSEACYKYNGRKDECGFDRLIDAMLNA